jgi:hypothetical protein
VEGADAGCAKGGLIVTKEELASAESGVLPAPLVFAYPNSTDLERLDCKSVRRRMRQEIFIGTGVERGVDVWYFSDSLRVS